MALEGAWCECTITAQATQRRIRSLNGDGAARAGAVADLIAGIRSREFDFMLYNPPYGKSWESDQERMETRAEFERRTGAALGYVKLTLHMLDASTAARGA